MRGPLIALVLVLAAVLPAHAQSTRDGAPRDVIGDLLNPRAPTAGEDASEPDTAGQSATPEPPVSEVRPVPRPGFKPSGLPAAPIPYAPAPRSQATEPVNVDETGKTPDVPPTVRDIAYDSRLRASFASAQSFQGPLEGGWTLATQEGGDLYALQLVDRRDRLEGVWRDVRRKGALDASGLVDDMQRSGVDLTFRFTPVAGGTPAVAVLHGAADGRWSGDLTEGDKSRPVTLRRSGP